jgi:hypothetical protein
MKMFGMILASVGAIALTSVAFANEHGECHGKDGKKIEAKDEAACKTAGGEWK